MDGKNRESGDEMKLLKKKCLFIAKHYDFLLVDLAAVILGFIVSLAFRRSMDMRLRYQNMLMTYGIAVIVSFLTVEILTENLDGIMARGLIKEIQNVVGQMTFTWTVYLSILFLTHTIFTLSRVLAVVTYLVCTVFLLLFRNAWKMICKFTRLGNSVMPALLIVSDAPAAQTVLNRMVSGALRKQYEISAVIVNDKGTQDYHDWYPFGIGLENIGKYIGQRRVQYAYVQLEDKGEEKKVIDQLLDQGIVVYRSLGDSSLQYADQSIGQLNEKSVIVISGAGSSLSARANRAWQKLRRRISRARG